MTYRQIPRPDRPTIRLMAAGALVFASACAAPILATETTRFEALEAAGAGVRCGVDTETRGGMTTFRPWVRLDPVRPGSYRFALSGGGTALDQGGSFDVGEAGQGLLGEATVTGPARGYDVDLTVTVGGTRYLCHGGGAGI